MADDSFKVIGLTDDELRRYALDEQRLHDPARQEGNPYERCELCHYTRHPCSTHDLATAVLQLLDRGRTDDPWQRVGDGEPVNEYTGLAAEQFLDRHEPRRP